MIPTIVQRAIRAGGKLWREVWRWWTTGLRATWVSLTSHLRRTSPSSGRVRVVLNENELSLIANTSGNDVANSEVASLALNLSSEEASKAFKSALKEATEVDVFIEGEGLLIRDLRYPRVAAADMVEVLTLELDKRTPFSVEQAYFTFRFLEETPTGREITVRLYTVPRTLISRAAKRLQELNIEAKGVFVKDGDYTSCVWQADSDPRWRWATGAFVWLGVCLALLFANVVQPLRAIARSVEHLEVEVEHLKQNARKESHKRLAESSLRESLSALLSAYNERMAISEVIRELNERLPRQAHLTSLHIEGARVTLTGATTDHDVIADAIDSSPFFDEVAFQLVDTPNQAEQRSSFLVSFRARPE